LAKSARAHAAALRRRQAVDLETAEEEWAAVVRELGIAACARAMGLTPQGLLRRVQKIETRREV
jgi:hypothetical protein